MRKFKPLHLFGCFLTLVVSGLPLAAHAAGSHDHAHAGSGAASEPKAASRTVDVVMHDNYFEPEALSVKPGETVLFKVTNSGSLVHEFSLGTPETHAASHGEMQMLVDHGVIQGHALNRSMMNMDMGNGHSMSYVAPHRILLAPGEQAELAWTFSQPGTAPFEFACNVPGHYAAGMVGEITAE